MMQRSKGVIGMGERESRRVTDEETKKSESEGDIRVRKKEEEQNRYWNERKLSKELKE